MLPHASQLAKGPPMGEVQNEPPEGMRLQQESRPAHAGARERRSPPKTHKSLLKALQVLSCFNDETPEWSVGELARHLDMPKSTLSSMLATLRSEDLLYQSPTTGRYRLGLRCLELGSFASSQLIFRDVAYPFLQSLLQSTQQIIYLGLPYRYQVIYVEALYPVTRKINYSSVGRRAPMYCTAIGKAMLSAMSEEALVEYLAAVPLKAYTANTITTAEKLLQELAATRERGYSIDAEEREEGIRCVGAPLRGPRGELLGAVSISGPSGEFTPETTESYGNTLRAMTYELSRKLSLLGLTGPTWSG